MQVIVCSQRHNHHLLTASCGHHLSMASCGHQPTRLGHYLHTGLLYSAHSVRAIICSLRLNHPVSAVCSRFSRNIFFFLEHVVKLSLSWADQYLVNNGSIITHSRPSFKISMGNNDCNNGSIIIVITCKNGLLL